MKQIIPLSVAAGLAVGGALALTGYSFAAAARTVVLPPIDASEWHEEPAPTPTRAVPPTNDPAGDPRIEGSCIPADQMLGVFALDVTHVGGEILALGDGLQQAFADSWRKTVGLPAVKVTQVFAHIVPADNGAAVVDVVEIDENGCALSRTLLSMDDWLEILKPLKSVEV
jgi:hypothetical protein